MTETAPELGGPFRGGPVGDFFAPFFTIQFQTYAQEDFAAFEGATDVGISAEPETGTVIFTDRATGKEVRTAESDIMAQLRNYVTTLEVSCPSEAQCVATITMEPPYFAALEIIDNQKVSMFSIMVIEFGYLNAGSGEQIKSDKHFYMVDKPELEMSGSEVTIKLRGADLFGVTAVRRTDRRDWPRIDYPTDLSILQEIAAETQMRLNIDLVPQTLFQQKTGSAATTRAQAVDSFGNHTFTNADLAAKLASANVSEVIHPLREGKLDFSLAGIVDSIHQDTKNWVFFLQLVRANNCSFFTVGNTVFIVDLNTARVAAPAFTLRYYQQPQGDRDIPMLTFSTNALTDFFIPPAAAGIRCASANPDDGVVNLTDFDPATSSLEEHVGNRTASGTGIQNGRVLVIDNNIQIRPMPKFSPTQVGEFLALPHGQQNRAETGRTPARRGSLVGNTKATCTIPGTPHLTPMMVVRIEGVGRVFGGNYLVMATTHRLGSDGYETELELVRDSITGDPVVGAGVTPSTGANDQTTDNRPGQEVPPVGPEDA